MARVGSVSFMRCGWGEAVYLRPSSGRTVAWKREMCKACPRPSTLMHVDPAGGCQEPEQRVLSRTCLALGSKGIGTRSESSFALPLPAPTGTQLVGRTHVGACGRSCFLLGSEIVSHLLLPACSM